MRRVGVRMAGKAFSTSTVQCIEGTTTSTIKSIIPTVVESVMSIRIAVDSRIKRCVIRRSAQVVNISRPSTGIEHAPIVRQVVCTACMWQLVVAALGPSRRCQ